MSAVPEWLKSLRLHKYTGLVKLSSSISGPCNFLTKCEKTKVVSADDEFELRGDVGPHRGKARKDGSYQGKLLSHTMKSIYCQLIVDESAGSTTKDCELGCKAERQVQASLLLAGQHQQHQHHAASTSPAPTSPASTSPLVIHQRQHHQHHCHQRQHHQS